MDKIRIGIFVKQGSIPTEGGGYSYLATLLEGINHFEFSPDIEIVNLVFYKKNIPHVKLNKEVLFIKSGLGNSIKDLVKTNLKKTGMFVSPLDSPIINFFYKRVINKRNRQAERIIQQHKIDLLYYLYPEPNVLNYPFITTHWDVMHKSTYAFPESSLDKHFLIREKYYLFTLNKAFLIFCESETGAAELQKYYPLFEGKIKVLPLFGSNIISHKLPQYDYDITLKKYGLKKGMFFLYPAQFWPSKNHYNLLIAFNNLKQEINDPDLKLVLCGSDKGNLAYIIELVNTLSLSDSVVMPGFVCNDELFILYKSAAALTMTTFLGPTNMPLIEAAHLNCPVLCSDLAGHKEILGSNALYFDPADSQQIKDCMLKILESGIRETLMKAAHAHIIQSPFHLNKTLQKLNFELSAIKSKRKTWGTGYIQLLILWTLTFNNIVLPPISI